MNISTSLRKLPDDHIRVQYGDPDDIWNSISIEQRANLSEERSKKKIELYGYCAQLLQNIWPSLLDSLPTQFNVPSFPSEVKSLEARFNFSVEHARSWFYSFNTILLNCETEKYPEIYNRIQELLREGARESGTRSVSGVIEAGFSAAFQTIEHCFTDPIDAFLWNQPGDFRLNSEQVDGLVDCIKKNSIIPSFLAMRHFERSLRLQNGRDGDHVPWLKLSLQGSDWELLIDENILVGLDIREERTLQTPTLGCPFHCVPQGLSQFNAWVFETVIIPCIQALK